MIYIELVSKVFLILAGLSYTLKFTTDKDLFEYIQNSMVTYIILLLIGLATLYNMFNRDYYLSFLGKTVIPISSKIEKSEKSNNVIDVVLEDLPRQTSVIYWASMKQDSQDILNYTEAYGNYSNSGIAQTDENGRVVVKIECPSEYTVPKFGFFRRKLNKHIHYRYEIPNKKGLYSRIYTKYITC
jgi:uncharacterized membrane protein YuzA (DUF378 family)